MTFLAIHFDGYGDDGATEEVKCFDSDYYEEHKPVDHNDKEFSRGRKPLLRELAALKRGRFVRH